jgi:hypothetical protein
MVSLGPLIVHRCCRSAVVCPVQDEDEETGTFYFSDQFGLSLCERMGDSEAVYLVADLSRLSCSSNQTNERDQKNQLNQIPATRRKIQNVSFFLPLTLSLLLVQNFTNSLQAGKMGAYLHARTYVSPTFLLTFLFPRRGP